MGQFQHGTARGSPRETFADTVLRKHLPNGFSVGSGIALDRYGKISRLLDFAIFDSSGISPPQPREGQLVIPVETLYAVVEVKETLTADDIIDAVHRFRTMRTLRTHQPRMDGPCPPAIPYAVIAFRSELSLDSVARRLRALYGAVKAADQLHVIHVLGKGVAHRGSRDGKAAFSSGSTKWRQMPEPLSPGRRAAESAFSWTWLQLLDHLMGKSALADRFNCPTT